MNTIVKKKNSVVELCIFALLIALMLGVQFAFSALPNIEMVSLFVMIYTLIYRYKTLYIIYGFVILEGFLWGFGVWWFTYLYVWTILWGITMLTSKLDSVFLRAVISGIFGLFFGMFTALPTLIIGGPGMAISYWLAGIPFDLMHCIGNFFIVLVLFKPLYQLLMKLHYFQNG